MAFVKKTAEKKSPSVVKEAVVTVEKKDRLPDDMFSRIQEKAYGFYVQRGYTAGDSLADWYKAEALVKKELGR
ncbi:MAG: DUF2934 domain-containing protein [Candidatus Omnitrophica bacterium]|nr:DUF2934 domain-containing protein [Candidatus Omnitrophota bacterium]